MLAETKVTIKSTEHQEQSAVVEWFRMQYPKYASNLVAIPNGGKRDIHVARKLKKEGTVAGASDLFLIKRNRGYCGMFIEMKTKTGKAQPTQLQFLNMVKQEGFLGIICYGADDAMAKIKLYMDTVI